MNKLMTCIILAVSMVLTVPSEELNMGSQRAAIFMNPVNQVFSFRFEEKEITNVNEDMTENIITKDDFSASEEIEEVEETITIEPAEKIMYAAKNVNIRKNYDKDSEKVGELTTGDSINITGICSNGWYRREYQSQEVYIAGNYLNETKPEVQQAEITPAIAPYEGFVQKEGNVDDKWLYEIEARYVVIPENIRGHFQRNGWSIVCTEYDLGARFFDSQIRCGGVTDYENKTIWIEDRQSAMRFVSHEIGHYIDKQNGWMSSSQEFWDIYCSEVETLRSLIKTHPNNLATPKEYFAEAYSTIIVNQDLMIENCPNTYDYIMNCANNLE